MTPFLLSTEENPPHYQQHRHHERKRKFPDVTKERRRVDLLLVRDRFDHEVRAIPNIGVRAKENGADTDGDDEFI